MIEVLDQFGSDQAPLRDAGARRAPAFPPVELFAFVVAPMQGRPVSTAQLARGELNNGWTHCLGTSFEAG